MYDTVSIYKPYKPPREVEYRTPEPFDWNGIIYVPNYCQGDGSVLNYKARVRNLQVTLTQFEINAKNSLHKFYSASNFNHADYTWSNQNETIEELEDTLSINMRDARVAKLAYGVNISTDFEPWRYFQYHVSKPFDKMKNRKGQEYGGKCSHSDYQIKCYDKAFDAKRAGIKIDPLQRFEIEVDYMRHLTKRRQPINILKVEDLLDKELQWQLAFDLLKKMNQIHKLPSMDISHLKPNEKILLGAWNHEATLADLRRHNRESYKQMQRQVKKLREQLKSHQMEDFERDVYYKLEELIET